MRMFLEDARQWIGLDGGSGFTEASSIKSEN